MQEIFVKQIFLPPNEIVFNILMSIINDMSVCYEISTKAISFNQSLKVSRPMHSIFIVWKWFCLQTDK